MKVVKRNEKREDFDRGKIKKGIIRAAERTGIDKKRVEEIAEEVSKRVEEEVKDKDEVRTEEIGRDVIRELESRERKIAEQFRSYFEKQR